MALSLIYILASLMGLAGAILVFIFVIPESKVAKVNNPFFTFLHDLFNFKNLLIEKILKFLYVLATVTSVIMGSLMLFWFEEESYYIGGGWYSDGYYETSYEWYGYYGLLVLILAPIMIRIFYEFVMMFVLLVQNTIDINKKLGAKKAAEAPVETPVEAAPVEEAPAKEAPKANFCANCGSIVDENGNCTNCSQQ